MTTSDERAGHPARKIRADVQRNEQALLAAATMFVTSGVEAPVRAIAAAAGVGMGTIYRHLPTRADLVVDFSVLLLGVSCASPSSFGWSLFLGSYYEGTSLAHEDGL